MSRDYNLRSKYIKEFGEIEKGYELHHKIPIHMGGSNNISNLTILSKECHADAHLKLYEQYGNFRDLCAYYMIGYNFSEAHRVSASEGGKIGGKKTYEQKKGIFRCDEERKVWASMGGKKSQQTLKEKGVSAYYDDNLRFDICSKGGKNGGFQIKSIMREGYTEEDAISEHKKRQSNRGKKGGSANKGFVWINDGIKSMKYTKKQQINEPLDVYLINNPQIKKGRI